MDTVTRSGAWGHWGLTFTSWQGERRPYCPTIHGTLYFGIGAAGPVDGTIGSPARQRYQAIMRAWMVDGVLPDGLDTRHATI